MTTQQLESILKSHAKETVTGSYMIEPRDIKLIVQSIEEHLKEEREE